LLDIHRPAALASFEKIAEAVEFGVGKGFGLGKGPHGLLGARATFAPTENLW